MGIEPTEHMFDRRILHPERIELTRWAKISRLRCSSADVAGILMINYQKQSVNRL